MSARSQSSFGQFQMSPSHLITGGEPLRERPKAADMAKMRRDGKTWPEIAEVMGLAVRTVRQRMSEAGYRPNGEPR